MLTRWEHRDRCPACRRPCRDRGLDSRACSIVGRRPHIVRTCVLLSGMPSLSRSSPSGSFHGTYASRAARDHRAFLPTQQTDATCDAQAEESARCCRGTQAALRGWCSRHQTVWHFPCPARRWTGSLRDRWQSAESCPRMHRCTELKLGTDGATGITDRGIANFGRRAIQKPSAKRPHDVVRQTTELKLGHHTDELIARTV